MDHAGVGEDRPAPGSTADRIAQRLRAREAGQGRDDGTGRTAERERGSVPGDGAARSRESIRDRLNRATAQLRERDARHELGERDDVARPEPEEGSTAERIAGRLRERERDDDRGRDRDVSGAGDPDRGPSTVERIEQELMERFQRQFPEEKARRQEAARGPESAEWLEEQARLHREQDERKRFGLAARYYEQARQRERDNDRER